MRGVFNQLNHHLSVLHADGSVLVPYYEHANLLNANVRLCEIAGTARLLLVRNMYR
jgi:isocitrate lyase